MYRVCSRRSCLLLLSAGLIAGNAQASGFRIPETSVTGLGTSNALVANQKDIGALAYNPAAMSFHDGNNLTAGLIVIDPQTSVDTTSGSHDSSPGTPFYVPDAYMMGHLSPNMTWGVGINAPFGLETKWDSGTFPGFAAAAAAAPPAQAAQILGSQPTYSRIEMLNFNPNVAYKIGDNLSVAGGLDYYYVNDVNLNTAGADIHGDGGEVGYNLAALFTTGPWSLGGSYRSAVSVGLNGEMTIGGYTSSARTSLDFPSILQLGVRHQTTDKLALEFDFDRTGWKTFDQIVITAGANPYPAPYPTQITSTNDWKDANAYRFGATYDVSEATQLRFGYTYDETPQEDAHFSARVPDGNRHLVSIGAAHKVNGWTVEGGYMFVKVQNRTVNGTAPFTGDPNGTALYNGTYKTTIHLLGLGVSTKF